MYLEQHTQSKSNLDGVVKMKNNCIYNIVQVI